MDILNIIHPNGDRSVSLELLVGEVELVIDVRYIQSRSDYCVTVFGLVIQRLGGFLYLLEKRRLFLFGKCPSKEGLLPDQNIFNARMLLLLSMD